MAMSVGFKLEASLEEALGHFKVSESQRGLVIVIDGEVLKLQHGPTAKTSDFAQDLTDLRTVVKALPAAFTLLRVDDKKEYALVIVMPETAKPKTKMIYASSALHLRNASHLGTCAEIQIDTVDALNPKLFGQDTEEQKRELMTEKEKIKEEMAKLETAPQNPTGGSALPGVGAKLDEATLQAAKDFHAKKLRGFVAYIDGAAIKLEFSAPFDQPRAAVVSKLPADKPRYAVIHWEDDKAVLVYVCPGSCKPKERMPYASMKPGFIAQLNHVEIKLAKNIETDDPAEVEAAVALRLAEHTEDEMKPVAPAKVANKGPRMLI